MALAGALLAAGLPGMLAAFERLGGEAAVGDVDDGRTLETPAAEEAALSVARATGYSASARRDLALVLLAEQPTADETVASRHERMTRIAEQLRLYLAQSPADARAWAALARALIGVEDYRAAAQALKASITLAPWSSGLVPWRAEMGMRIASALDPAMRDMIAGQIALYLRRDRADLFQLVEERALVSVGRALLARNQPAAAAFDRMLDECGGNRCR